ncbi:HlyD family secretion protein [Flavobacteriales bacterium]|nr:HlyD family secretion protein [Flavobacteriales bacterium]
MLNISKNKISKKILEKRYSTVEMVEAKISSEVLRRGIYAILICGLVTLLLPWTQNIRSNGYVSVLKPNQKPQTINSIIGGRIEKWYTKEGDYVKAGDTILQISEIMDKYFDTDLLKRTKEQIEFKKQSVKTYSNKISVQERQISSLNNQLNQKLNQASNKLIQAALKVQIDSNAYAAAGTDNEIAIVQLKRTDSLYKSGLKSLTDFEKKKLNQQKVKAKFLAFKNKWLTAQNNMMNSKIEIEQIKSKFNLDLNELQSKMLSTVSQKLDTENSLIKLENQYVNYQIRNGFYFITAPINGYITKTKVNGIGEIIKAGQQILTMMPNEYQMAVETYIDPIDLPLVSKNENVRIQFDGWPAIVFSGWPNASHGTYDGKIYAIDQFISSNGKYRVLIAPDTTKYVWPKALRVGAGASSMILLNDVSIFYELWRNINGFPPDFYSTAEQKELKNKK